MKIRGVSLFSGAGIGETFLKDLGFDIIVANELLPKRADLYQAIYPETKMVCGDISNEEIYKKITAEVTCPIDIILASPPCQGLSIAGKNRNQASMVLDQRNFLIFYVIRMIKELNPNYVLIENVSSLLKLLLPHQNNLSTIKEILEKEIGESYTIETRVLDAADLGVPQKRVRALIKLFKKNLEWPWPTKEKKITVKQAIGSLPTLEAGERSNLQWHFARYHKKEHLLWMKHTPTGKSAFENIKHFPQKADGQRIRGYLSTYRRIRWDEPAPTITIRNDAISSQRNVHPGRLLEDGTYSDARVLTPLELIILNSLPANWNIPPETPELLIRQCIGESIPPLMMKKILESIKP